MLNADSGFNADDKIINVQGGKRNVPWADLGFNVEGAPNSEQAIKMAGLDWKVVQKKVTYNDEETGWNFNVREDSDSVLGVVKGRYIPIQNDDAFSFMDELIGEDVRYETAGALHGGKRIWLLARMPEEKLFDDEYIPYMCLMNSHDGTGSLKVCMTPIRVVCQNTLNLALETAKRTWTVRHTKSIEQKVAEAKATLRLAEDYMQGLIAEANDLYKIKVSNNQFEQLLDQLFPVKEEDGVRKINSQELAKDQMRQAYNMDDLGNLKGTAWGFINAVSDMSTHKEPSRKTGNYEENLFINTLEYPMIFDKAYALVKNLK